MRFVPGGAGPGCAARDPGLPALGSALGRPCPATTARSLLAAVTLLRAGCPYALSSAAPSGISSAASPIRHSAALRRPRGAPEDGWSPLPRAHRYRASAPGPGQPFRPCPVRRDPALGSPEFLNPERRLLFPLTAPGAVPEHLVPDRSRFPGRALFSLPPGVNPRAGKRSTSASLPSTCPRPP